MILCEKSDQFARVEMHYDGSEIEVLVDSVEGMFLLKPKLDGKLAVDMYRHPFAYRHQATEDIPSKQQYNYEEVAS